MNQSHLPALGDSNVLIRPISGCSGVFYHTNYLHPIDDLPEDYMLVIQEWRSSCCNEELASVCIWPRILGMVSDGLNAGEGSGRWY
jgi:hypothetical protein